LLRFIKFMFLLLCGIGYCSVASALFVVISVATFGVVVADVASIVESMLLNLQLLKLLLLLLLLH
jgi:hypothetical protein